MDTEKFYKSFKLAQSQLKYLKEQNIVTNDLDFLVNEDGDFYIKMSSIDIDYIKKHLRGDRFYITTEDDKKEHKTKEYAKSLMKTKNIYSYYVCTNEGVYKIIGEPTEEIESMVERNKLGLYRIRDNELEVYSSLTGKYRKLEPKEQNLFY